MMKQIVYDFTRNEETLTSLSNYLGIGVRDIRTYSFLNKDNFNINEFFKNFGIDDEKLLTVDLMLASLHVTTNNDNFDSIKKYGLVNLQKSIELDTTIGRFLKSLGIVFDVQNKELKFKNKVYDLSKKFESVTNPIDAVIRKLYMDYQINSFFNYKNVLEYGVQNRPEFFLNLSELLREDISQKWIKQNNQCYVVKFIVPISNIIDYTFDISEDDKEYLDKRTIEIMKRKWIINQSFEKLNDNFYANQRECYCYLKVDSSVPFSNIIKIYNPEEYMKEYRVED